MFQWGSELKTKCCLILLFIWGVREKLLFKKPSGSKGPRRVYILLHLCSPEVNQPVKAGRRAGGIEVHKG